MGKRGEPEPELIGLHGGGRGAIGNDRAVLLILFSYAAAIRSISSCAGCVASMVDGRSSAASSRPVAEDGAAKLAAAIAVKRRAFGGMLSRPS
ncbi:MAG: hypothetical protein R3F54_19025 [Alphaproteobacteria bacterium]